MSKKRSIGWLAADLPGLSVENSLKCFNLFIDGCSAKQIVAVIPGLQLGAVLKTKVNDNWEDRRQELMGELYRESAINAKFSYLKSMNFVSGLLEVYNRRYEMNIKKFLESGNERRFRT